MSALTRARQVRAGPRLCFCGDVGQRVSPWMESSPHAWVKVEMAGFSWGRRRANIFNVPPDASRNRPAHTGPQGDADGTGPCVRGCGVPRAQGAGGPPRAIRPARRRDPSVIRLVSGRETYTDRSYYTRALAALVPGERRSVGTVTDRAVEGTGVRGQRGFNRAVYVWLRRGRGASLEYRIIIAPLAASPRIATIASICSAPWSRARLAVADATPHRPPRPMSPGMRPAERLPRGYRSAQGPAGTGTIEE